nr:hypothetical protein [Tanacetum cinerariifolium]
MNVFMRIGFGSTIELVSFDEIQSDNTVDSSHGFIIHGIEIFKGNEEVTEVIDVENWRIDNSRVLRRIVSLIEGNSSVLSTKSSIQSTFRFRKAMVRTLPEQIIKSFPRFIKRFVGFLQKICDFVPKISGLGWWKELIYKL